MSRAVKLAQTVQEMFRQADLEGRVLTAEERSHAEALLEEAKSIGHVEQSLADIGRQLGGNFSVAGDGSAGIGAGAMFPNLNATSPGARFVNSEAFKSISNADRRASQWTIGPVPITDGPPTLNPYVGLKGTLLEGLGAPGSGSGGGFIAAPQVVPGVVDILFQPLSVERSLSAGIATGSTVRYVQQGTATSGAAGVLEGGLKPESTIGLGTKDEQIKKVATFLPISTELLEDAPAVQTFINNQLLLYVAQEVERELLRGNGTNEVQGLLNGRGVPVYAGGTAAGNMAEQLFKAMNGVRGSAYVEPDFAIVNYLDYQTIRLLKDNSGQLYGGGPFFGSYGSGVQANASSQLTGGTDFLWGKSVHVTSSLGQGTAIVGASSAAAVMSRGGASVEMSTSHSNFFQLNLVAVRAERRLGLCVYRPQGLCEVRLS